MSNDENGLQKFEVIAKYSSSQDLSGIKEFFDECEGLNMDLTRIMSWRFIIEDLRKDDIKALKDDLHDLGYREIDPDLNDEMTQRLRYLDVDDKQEWEEFEKMEDTTPCFVLWFREYAIHTPESLTKRINEIKSSCTKYNGKYSHLAVGPPDDDERLIIFEKTTGNGIITGVHVKKDDKVECNQLLYKFRSDEIPALEGEHRAKRAGKIAFVAVLDGQAVTKNEIIIGIYPEITECFKCKSVIEEKDFYCPKCGERVSIRSPW
ncbi:MAG: hypothetical protein ACFFD4_19375 [Candidatus Odinarchaeota archaeon]